MSDVRKRFLVVLELDPTAYRQGDAITAEEACESANVYLSDNWPMQVTPDDAARLAALDERLEMITLRLEEALRRADALASESEAARRVIAAMIVEDGGRIVIQDSTMVALPSEVTLVRYRKHPYDAEVFEIG